jgi:glutamate carboxypeptidase
VFASTTAFLDSRLDSYLADLATLVGMDSFSYDKDDVNQVVDWLETRLNRLNFTVQR